MSQLFLLALVGVTSAGTYGLCRQWLGWPAPLRHGIQKTLETVGVAVAFFVVNVGVTVFGTLALRSLGLFVSLYIATDYTLIALSLLQAIALQHWRYTDAEDKRN